MAVPRDEGVDQPDEVEKTEFGRVEGRAPHVLRSQQATGARVQLKKGHRFSADDVLVAWNGTTNAPTARHRT